MATRASRAPVLGMILSACVPGLGHAYVGAWGTVIVVAAVAAALVAVEAWWFLATFHVFQIVAARGAVRRWNADHAADEQAPVPPPVRRVQGENR